MSFFPQENPPALQISDVLDLTQKAFHLFFVHANIVDDFIVLFSKLLQSGSEIVFHLVEEEEVVTKSLNNPLDFLL